MERKLRNMSVVLILSNFLAALCTHSLASVVTLVMAVKSSSDRRKLEASAVRLASDGTERSLFVIVVVDTLVGALFMMLLLPVVAFNASSHSGESKTSVSLNTDEVLNGRNSTISMKVARRDLGASVALAGGASVVTVLLWCDDLKAFLAAVKLAIFKPNTEKRLALKPLVNRSMMRMCGVDLVTLAV